MIALTSLSRPVLTRAQRWQISEDGWLPAAHRTDSPNFDARTEGHSPRLLVIHAISLPPDTFGGTGIDELFTNRLNPDEHPYYKEIAHLKVSAHFLIRRNGELV